MLWPGVIYVHVSLRDRWSLWPSLSNMCSYLIQPGVYHYKLSVMVSSVHCEKAVLKVKV